MKCTATFYSVAAATLVAGAYGTQCGVALVAVLSIPEITTCQTASGWSLASPTLTPDTLAKFCSSDACLKVLAAVKALELPECTISGSQLYKGILDPAEAACSSLDHTAHNHTSSSSNSTGAPTKTPSSASGTVNNNSTAVTKIPTTASATAAKTPSALTQTSSAPPFAALSATSVVFVLFAASATGAVF